MRKKQTNDRRTRAPNDIAGVLESAKKGAASRFGHSRLDVIEEIAATVVHKYLAQAQEGCGPIRSPCSWAFRVGQNEATAWIAREKKFISMQGSLNPEELRNRAAKPMDFEMAGKSSFQGQDEVLEALPELFRWFQSRVVERLGKHDRLFFERYYLDRWSEQQLAVEFNITEKAVAQRWRRLLLRLRRELIKELPNWDRGNELFSDALQNPKSLVDLLCLVRLFVKDGIEAIRGIIESFTRE